MTHTLVPSDRVEHVNVYGRDGTKLGSIERLMLDKVSGTVAYAVRQRTHEIGIRMALGATTHHVLHLVVRQGMVWVLCGFFIGLLLALVLTRVLTSSIFEIDLLYGVSSTDFVTYLGVSALVFVTTLLACYLPARRATKVDPLVALRYE